MITYKKTLTETDFYTFFLKLLSLQAPSKELRLTSNEIKLLVNIINDPNCLYGSSREAILKKYGWSHAHFSNTVKGLERKSMIVKTGVKKYGLNYNLTSLKNLVQRESNIDILFKITKNVTPISKE
jgi:hypothetical protein